MAFADPQSVTINAIASSLPRVGFGVGEGKFKKDDGNMSLTLRQRVTAKGRKQSAARLDDTMIGADPFNGALNASYSRSITLTADIPPVGFTQVQNQQFATGFITWLTANSNANLIRLLGGEV